MTNSRAKGARGEREWAAFLRDAGYNARRGQQFAGGKDSPDVVVEGMEGFHPEVKRVERLNINDAMAQAQRDCGDLVPYVAHRKNDCEWYVTMRAADWVELLRWLP